MRALALLFFTALASAPAVLLDEIAITVGNQAITQSEILREIRLSALLNGETPEATVDSRRKAADRLIEQALIRREMQFGSYPAPPATQIEEIYNSTVKARGGAEALDKLLRSYDLTDADLRDYLTWQLTLLRFIDLRFRPAVQVTEDDVEKYYKESVAGQTTSKANPPTLKELHDQIEQKLTGERVDAQVDAWIKRSRTRTAIHYIDASLGVTPAAPLQPETAQPH